ncbi:MAG: cytochrome c-type biogenesis protein [Myxococcota bacterium]|nr:cytochrome c-type biogenesis protein [Myxococcota bacterium]
MIRWVQAMALGLFFALLLSAQTWTEDLGELGGETDLLALGIDIEDRVGSPSGTELRGPELESRTEALSSVLRCPVCQGLSISDSPSESARKMKRQVRAMLAAGYDEDQVKDYFVAAYGDFVLMLPEPRGFNLLVWGLPAGLILLGGVLGLRTIRKQAPAEAAPLPAVDEDPLGPWIEQVRAEANKE